MPRLHRDSLAHAAAFLLLAAATVPVAGRVLSGMAAERFEIRQVPASSALRFLDAGARLTVADYYWLQVVQYIGETSARAAGYPRLHALAELITDLDPAHGYAYQTAGIALSVADRLEESDAILKKGMTRGPGWWSYPFYLAFNDFHYRGDYASAARWAEQAARTPGATPNMSKLALALKVKSGSPEDAVALLAELRATVTDDRIREALDEQYRLAVLQRDFAVLDAALAAFRARAGHDPAGLPELVAAGLLARLPEEPFGGRYVLRDGGVHSTGRDFRFPAAEPGRRRRTTLPWRDGAERR